MRILTVIDEGASGFDGWDITQAYALLEGFDFERLIADRGYAAANFMEYLLVHGIQAFIPPHQR